MTEIASKLETLASANLELIPWEKLEPQWQEKILRAISPTDSPPSYLVYPHTSQALSTIFKLADQHGWAVLICGNGTKLNWGGLVNKVDLVVSTAHLNRLIEHAVGDLTVTVEAGIKLAELQATLKQEKQFLPLDPAYPDQATIGGIVATADAGSWRQRYGGVRDLVLGLSFVRADGEIAKAGGRVVKNVAGYDLMKLFTGSYGTLGTISEVNLRVYPLPEASATLLLTGEPKAIASLVQTLHSAALTPTAAEILSPKLLQDLQLGQGLGLLVRFQSIEQSVQEQAAQLEVAGQKLGLTINNFVTNDELQLLQKLLNSIFASASTSPIHCKIGVTQTAVVSFLAEFDRLTAGRGLGIIGAGSGIGRLNLEPQAVEKLAEMRSLCQKAGGFLTILEAPTTIKQQLDPWGYKGNALELMRKLKQQFDPKNILCPGHFVGGI